MNTSLQSPLPQYAGRDGMPLHGGMLYFGVAGANPVTSPITVYWDAQLTQPASQPIDTVGGMPSRNGNPAPLFVSESVGVYSLLALEADGQQAYYDRAVRRQGGDALMAVNIAITATSIRLDFPAGSYLPTLPVVLVTVLGNAATQVDVASTPEYVDGYGEVYTHIDLTFQAGAVGKRANVWVAA